MNNKLNIVYFCASSIFGGVERFIDTCLEGHREEGEDHVELFFLSKGEFFDHCQNKKYEVNLSPIKVRLLNLASWVRFQFYFYKFIKNKDVDIVHLGMPYAQLFCALPIFFSKAKGVWFQHGPIGGVLDRAANLLPYDHIIFNSEYTKKSHLKNAGKIKAPDTVLKMEVRTSFDMKRVQEIQKEYQDQDGLYIATGRICRWKGFEISIKALSLLSEANVHPKLLIVGRPSTEDDNKYAAELKNLVISLGLEKQILFLGFQKDIYNYIRAADALIHSSKTPEPYGLVVAEAISLGTYVFAVDEGGVAEQLGASDKNGTKYGPLDSERQLFMSIMSRRAECNKESNQETVPESKDQVFGMMQILRKIYHSNKKL